MKPAAGVEGGKGAGPAVEHAVVVLDESAELAKGDSHELDCVMEAGDGFRPGFGLEAEQALVERDLFKAGAGDEVLHTGGFGEGRNVGEEFEEAAAARLRGEAEHAGFNKARVGEEGIVEGGDGGSGGEAEFGLDNAAADGGLGLALIEAQEVEVVGGEVVWIGEESGWGRIDGFVTTEVVVTQTEDGLEFSGGFDQDRLGHCVHAL